MSTVFNFSLGSEHEILFVFVHLFLLAFPLSHSSFPGLTMPFFEIILKKIGKSKFFSMFICKMAPVWLIEAFFSMQRIQTFCHFLKKL
jgi:hypothetical protein